jgi:hypothetical protein
VMVLIHFFYIFCVVFMVSVRELNCHTVYPAGTGWPGYTPRHWVPFSSPPTTRRVTVEVFDPASTRDCDLSESQSYFTTGGLPPIDSSWRQAPGDSRPEIFSIEPLW